MVNHTVASPRRCCCICWGAIRTSALAKPLATAIATSTCSDQADSGTADLQGLSMPTV